MTAENPENRVILDLSDPAQVDMLKSDPAYPRPEDEADQKMFDLIVATAISHGGIGFDLTALQDGSRNVFINLKRSE